MSFTQSFKRFLKTPACGCKKLNKTRKSKTRKSKTRKSKRRSQRGGYRNPENDSQAISTLNSSSKKYQKYRSHRSRRSHKSTE